MTTLDRTAGVVVAGGGPAATWAALKAVQAGADMVLADQGYCGTSGATASGGTGVVRAPAPHRPVGPSPAPATSGTSATPTVITSVITS